MRKLRRERKPAEERMQQCDDLTEVNAPRRMENLAEEHTLSGSHATADDEPSEPAGNYPDESEESVGQEGHENQHRSVASRESVSNKTREVFLSWAKAPQAPQAPRQTATWRAFGAAWPTPTGHTANFCRCGGRSSHKPCI